MGGEAYAPLLSNRAAVYLMLNNPGSWRARLHAGAYYFCSPSLHALTNQQL